MMSATLPEIMMPGQGTIRPKCASNGTLAYLGIPFAQAPLGALRWKPPQGPPPSWTGVRESRWADNPVQNGKTLGDLWRTREGQAFSGDCLYLNIWVPSGLAQGSSQKLPVMCWVYGGAFVGGTTSQPIFDGARLAEQSNAVVSSVSYRVGALGWLSSRELQREGPGDHPLPQESWAHSHDQVAGNYGLWDVAAAFDWVKQNIGHFGGDQDNITAFGESAGSIILHYLILSPVMPRDLFHRAILQSGTAHTVLPRTNPSLQATADALAAHLGCSHTASDAEKLKVLRSATASELLETSAKLPVRRPRVEYTPDETNGRPIARSSVPQAQIQMEPLGAWGPAWDGFLVSKDHFRDIADVGLPDHEELRNARHGIVVSFCIDEGTMFNLIEGSSKEGVLAHASRYHPHLRDSVHSLYGLNHLQSDEEAFAAIASYSGDAPFQAPIVHLMRRLAEKGATAPPSFGFVFAHRYSSSLSEGLLPNNGPWVYDKLGVAHTAEIPFVFGNDGSGPHTWASSEGYGTSKSSDEALRSTASSAPAVGFTPSEAQASANLISRLSRFIRGEQPWAPLRSDNGTLSVLAIGDASPLGSSHPEATSTYATDEVKVAEKPLQDMRVWRETIGPAGKSTEERHAFWMDQRQRNLWVHYYGDDGVGWYP